MNSTTRSAGYKWILLDADGVLQSPEQPFVTALEQIAGDTAEALLADTFRGDGPVITGRQEVLPVLGDFLRAVGSDADPREVYVQLWESIHLHEDVLELVDSWRSTGRRVALTTNQDPGRARFMGNALAFDERFDRSYYSCNLGAGKPSARYFKYVLADLQVEPSEVIFIDDTYANVVAAKHLGLAAHRWQHGDNLGALARCVGAAPEEVPPPSIS
ncbi:HAD-IA family hydrolase [Curtobacterium sp. 1544]|uniref:HAD family hydrolase n=1 Tax=Curtobacterium sp. 1544 TaxID=3156417 RepID=UPI003390A859